MEEKEIIKYLDIVFKEISDFNSFGIGVILSDKIKHESQKEIEYFNKVVKEVSLFGKNNDLFIQISTESWFKLTPKGKELKKSNLGFNKFEKKSTKTPLTLYQKIHLTITIISVIGVLTFSYLTFDYKKENKKINNENIILKDTINKLKSQIELYKVSSLNDTLQTNNLNH